MLDPLAEVGFTDAAKIEPDFEVGEELYEEIDILDLAVVPFLLPNKHASRISDLKKMY